MKHPVYVCTECGNIFHLDIELGDLRPECCECDECEEMAVWAGYKDEPPSAHTSQQKR